MFHSYAELEAYLRPPDAWQEPSPSRDACVEAQAVVQAWIRRARLQHPVSKAAFNAAILAAIGSSDKSVARELQKTMVQALVENLLEGDPDSLLELASGLVPSLQRDHHGRIVVHVLDYLAGASQCPVALEPQYLSLDRGYAHLGAQHLGHLLVQTMLERHAVRPPSRVPGRVRDSCKELITGINGEIGRRRAERTSIKKLGRQAEHYPPCIQVYLQRLHRQQPLTHHMRFNLVAFLNHQGEDISAIVERFSGLPDFDEAKTSYQVEHIIRNGYSTMSCAKMRDYGICMDATCKGRTPIREYAWRVRMANKRRPRPVLNQSRA